MNMYKKVASIVLSFALFLGAGTVNVFAEELPLDAELQLNTVLNEEVEMLSTEEYEKVLAAVSQRAQDAITPELIEEVKVLRQEIENSETMQILKSSSLTRASYDTVSLEVLLDTHDGLSLVDIAAIGIHANAARDEASDLYTDVANVEMKEDAFRHMTWNFRAIKDVGESKTRIATINHEWQDVIFNVVTQYENERYNYYFDLYRTQITWGLMPVDTIINMAKADADAYAITYRDALLQECKDSLEVFNSVFANNSFIMDFWNNKVGRDYGKSNPDSSTNEVFVDAWNANKLIKHEGASAVTDDVRSFLYSTNWWYIM